MGPCKARRLLWLDTVDLIRKGDREMQMIHPPVPHGCALVGWGASVLLISGADQGGQVAHRLAALGAKVEVRGVLCDAPSLLPEGACEIDLLVIDCDHAGGIDAGRRTFDRLAGAGLQLPVMLISSDCAEQIFPPGREAPFHLRAPVSAVALRIGFEQIFMSRIGSDPAALSVGEPGGPEKGRSQAGAPFRI